MVTSRQTGTDEDLRLFSAIDSGLAGYRTGEDGEMVIVFADGYTRDVDHRTYAIVNAAYVAGWKNASADLRTRLEAWRDGVQTADHPATAMVDVEHYDRQFD